MERYGSYLELMLKLIYRRCGVITGEGSLDSAGAVFAAKWDSIPHTRDFASWVMDVLENPFVRLPYFFEPQDLCRQMYDKGFVLYGSWPAYRDGLCIDWVKKPWKADEALHSQSRFVAQSRLSHLFGEKCFLLEPDERLEQSLDELLTLTDQMIDEFRAESSAQCRELLVRISAMIRFGVPLVCEQDRASLLRRVDWMVETLLLLERGNENAVVAFCNSNPAFIKFWGVPFHHAVFMRCQYFPR